MRLAATTILAGMLLVACGGGGTATGTAPGGAKEQAGEPAPDVSFETFEGGEATLADFHGPQPLVVNFWASWCPPCIAEMPDLEEVHQAVGEEVSFLGMNTQDSEDAAERLAEETGVTYPLARDPDGEIAQTFGVFGMPSTYFITADGRLVHTHTGALTGERLRELITEHLGV